MVLTDENLLFFECSTNSAAQFVMATLNSAQFFCTCELCVTQFRRVSRSVPYLSLHTDIERYERLGPFELIKWQHCKLER